MSGPVALVHDSLHTSPMGGPLQSGTLVVPVALHSTMHMGRVVHLWERRHMSAIGTPDSRFPSRHDTELQGRSQRGDRLLVEADRSVAGQTRAVCFHTGEAVV